MAELKLVIFDVDGTLVDSIAHIQAVMAEAFAQAGLAEPPRDRIRALIGISLPELLYRLQPSLSASEHATVMETYKSLFAQMRMDNPIETTAPLFPGAAEALERLAGQDELLMAVATGKSRRGYDHIASAYGWDRLFQSVQCADSHPSKPHPSMIEACLHDTGAEAAHAVIIGDTSHDLQMGKNAGIRSIGVHWGNHPAEELQPLADAMLNDFSQLETVLQRIWEA